MGFNIPVMVVAFNRPNLVSDLIDILRQVQAARVYVVIDGPRTHKPADGPLAEETKQLFSKKIDWDCNLTVNASGSNLGVRRRVASGLSWVFSREECAIVLEDDCRPQLSFFQYCAEMLEKYKDDLRVMSVCGTKSGPYIADKRYSYFFSRYFLPWGWATWRDRWQRFYDAGLETLNEPQLETWLREALGSYRAGKYWHWLLTRVRDGKNNSWAYSWMIAGYLQHMLHVTPGQNLITNVGMGQAAVHTKKRPIYAPIQTFPMEFPLRHPQFMLPAKGYDKWLEDFGFSKSMRGRTLWMCKKILGKA